MSNNDDDEDFTLYSGSPDERWLTNFFGSNSNEGSLENTNTHSIHPNNNHATADNTHVIHAVSQLSQGETTETSVNATKGRPKNDDSSPPSTPDQRKKQKVDREDTDYDDDDMILQQEDKPSESCACCAGTGACVNRNNTTIRYSSRSDGSPKYDLSSMMPTLGEFDLELIQIGTAKPNSPTAVIFPCARVSQDDDAYDNEQSQFLKEIHAAEQIADRCNMNLSIVKCKYEAIGVTRHVGFGSSPAFRKLKNDIILLQQQRLLKDKQNIWLMFNDVLRIGLEPSHFDDLQKELNELDIANVQVQTVRQFDLGTDYLRKSAAVNERLNTVIGKIHEKSSHVNAAKELPRSYKNQRKQEKIDKCMRKYEKKFDEGDTELNTFIDNAHGRINLLPQGGSDFFDFFDNLCEDMDNGVTSPEEGVKLFLKYIDENFEHEKKRGKQFHLGTTACSPKRDSNKNKKTANGEDSVFQCSYILGFYEASGINISDDGGIFILLRSNQRKRRGVLFPEEMALGLLAVGCQRVIDNTATTSTRVGSFLWRNMFFNGVHEATDTPLYLAQHVGVTNDLTINTPTCHKTFMDVSFAESERLEDEMKAYNRAKKEQQVLKETRQGGNITSRIKDPEEKKKFQDELEVISKRHMTDKFRVGINTAIGTKLFMTGLTTSETSISAHRQGILHRQSMNGDDDDMDELTEAVTTKVTLTTLDAGDTITKPRGCDVKLMTGSFLPNQGNKVLYRVIKEKRAEYDRVTRNQEKMDIRKGIIADVRDEIEGVTFWNKKHNSQTWNHMDVKILKTH
jgi:hypothetical protein